jgi:hypothetical protein
MVRLWGPLVLVGLLSAVVLLPDLHHNLLFLRLLACVSEPLDECQADPAVSIAGLDMRSRAMVEFASRNFTETARIYGDAEESSLHFPLDDYFHVESLIRAGDNAAAVEALNDVEVRRLFEKRGIDLEDEIYLSLAIQAGSANPHVYYSLGDLNREAQPARAIADYIEGLARDTARDTPQAQLAAAYVARQQKAWPQVEAAFQAAVEYTSEPNQLCDIFDEAATVAMFEAQDGARAVAWAEQLQSRCPWRIDGLLHLIYFNTYLGRNEQALVWYDAAQSTRFAGSPLLEEARQYVLHNR